MTSCNNETYAERSLSLLRTLSTEHVDRQRHSYKDNINNSNNLANPALTSTSSFLPSPFSIMGNRNSSNNNRRDLEAGDYFEDNAYYEDDIRRQKRNRSFKRQHSSSSRSQKKKEQTVDDLLYNDDAQQYYTLEELVDQNIYVVKQPVGYLSIAFSIVQTVVLALMMIMCSVAPLNINRKLYTPLIRTYEQCAPNNVVWLQ